MSEPIGRNTSTTPAPAISWSDEIRTYATITTMQAMAAAGARDPLVRSIAAQLAMAPRPLEAIFNWVQSHVRYVDDQFNVHALGRLCADCEDLIPPGELIRMDDPQDDCDGFSMLTAALITAAGLGEGCFRTLAADPRRPDEYSHVYVIGPGGEVIDTSHGPYLGWQAAPGARTRFGGMVSFVGHSRDWGCRQPSRLQGLGSAFTDALLEQLPLAAQTGRDIALRQLTPAGYYQSSSSRGNMDGRVATSDGTIPSLSTSPFSGFPWGWALVIVGGAIALKALRK